MNTLLSDANHGSPPTARRGVYISNPTTFERAFEAPRSKSGQKTEENSCHQRASGVVFLCFANSEANNLHMKHKALTQIIRERISRDERTRYDEAYMLLHVFEQYGFILTETQREIVASLPKPASVMRIARRELKAQGRRKTQS